MTDIPHTGFQPGDSAGTAAANGSKPFAVAALVMVIFFTTHSFYFLFSESSMVGLVERTSVRSNPVYLLFVAAQMGIVALLLLRHILSNPLPLRLIWAGLICLYITGSALWSVDPFATLSNGIILSYLVLAAYVASVSFEPDGFVRIYFRTMAFIILVSFAILAVAPDLVGYARGDGGWLSDYQFRGVTGTKDQAGGVFVSAFVVACLARSLGISAVWRYGIILFAAAGLLITNSATSIVILFLLIALAFYMRVIGLLRFEVAFVAAVLALAVVLALPFIDPGAILPLELIGRDPSLTGRDELWELAKQNFMNRPLFGHGYYGFFNIGPYSPVWSFWENFKYFRTDAFHNSAMDISVALGLTGIAILCAVCLTAAGIVFNRSIDEVSRTVIVLLVIAGLVSSATNFSFLSHNSINTFIIFYAFFASGRAYRGKNLAARQAPARPSR